MEQAVTLGYWDIRGLAESIRQLLQYLDIPYKEEKYAGVEGRTKWFNQVKPNLLEKNPAVTLPYLIDGEKVITESAAIRGKPELIGRSAEQQVALATAHGVYKDLHPHYIRLVYSNYNNEYTFDQALTKSLEDFSPYLKKFNGLLGEKLFIAGELTWFDFALADFLQTLSLLHPSYQNPYPKLIEYYQRIWGLPELKPYFNSQRYRERPCNNYTATWK